MQSFKKSAAWNVAGAYRPDTHSPTNKHGCSIETRDFSAGDERSIYARVGNKPETTDRVSECPATGQRQ